jgi:hypothetical protein
MTDNAFCNCLGFTLECMDNMSTTQPTNGQIIGYNATNDEWEPINNSTGTITCISQGTGMSFSTNPIVSTGTINLANTTVTPGAYASANITVGQQGWITSVSNGGNGTVTSVSQSTSMNFSTNPITNTGTINLANTAITPGFYTLCNITLD